MSSVLLTVVFEGPFARRWYETRQDHLAASFGEARADTKVGQALAVLQSEEHDLNLIVVEGVATPQLRSAPGHDPGTTRPGEVGNAVIFGHRSGWGGPFGRLARARVGDAFVAQAHLGVPDEYRVETVARVPAGDPQFLGRSNDVRITLVTAAGKGRWLVVTAVAGEPGRVAAAEPGHVPTPGGAPLVDMSMGWMAAAGAVLVLIVRTTGDLRGGVRAALLAPIAALVFLLFALRLDALFAALR